MKIHIKQLCDLCNSQFSELYYYIHPESTKMCWERAKEAPFVHIALKEKDTTHVCLNIICSQSSLLDLVACKLHCNESPKKIIQFSQGKRNFNQQECKC